MISTNTLLSLSGAVGTFALGLSATWFSRKSAKLSAPCGNGFAQEVKDSLGRIENRLELLDTRVTRMEGKRDGKAESARRTDAGA